MTLKHDWSSLQTYLNAHERVLNTYGKYMDKPRVYKTTRVTANYLLLECVGILFTTYTGTKVRVDITKDAEIDDSNPKRTRALAVEYNYNANEPQGDNLLRYDSPDSFVRLGRRSPLHHFYHHKHVWVLGQEEIIRVADDAWPHVDEFFHEVLTDF